MTRRKLLNKTLGRVFFLLVAIAVNVMAYVSLMSVGKVPADVFLFSLVSAIIMDLTIIYFLIKKLPVMVKINKWLDTEIK